MLKFSFPKKATKYHCCFEVYKVKLKSSGKLFDFMSTSKKTWTLRQGHLQFHKGFGLTVENKYCALLTGTIWRFWIAVFSFLALYNSW